MENGKLKIENESCYAKKNNYALRIVLGMVGDKDVRTSLSLMPKEATYYFTQASVKRAMPVEEFAAIGQEMGLQGKTYKTVAEAYRAALHDASADDFVFVGGSSFVVADLLTYLKQ